MKTDVLGPLNKTFWKGCKLEKKSSKLDKQYELEYSQFTSNYASKISYIYKPRESNDTFSFPID